MGLRGWFVLFDWNGTLVDDAERARMAFNEVLRRRSRREIEPDDFAGEFRLPLRAMFEHLGLSGDLERAEAEWNVAMRSRPPVLRPEVVPLLVELRRLGARTGVVSAAGASALRADLAETEVRHLLDEVHSAVTDKSTVLRDVRRGDRCAYVGDTDYDVSAARSVGYVAVGLTTGYQPAAVVRAAEPDIELTRLDHLIASLSSWPAPDLPAAPISIHHRTYT